MRTGGRIGEEKLRVARARVTAVNPICRPRAALDPARYLDFVIVALRKDRYLCELALRTGRGSGKDHVVHAGPTQRLWRTFAHRPSDSLEQIGFAAAIWANYAREPSHDPQLDRIDERLEPGKFDPRDLHLRVRHLPLEVQAPVPSSQRHWGQHFR